MNFKVCLTIAASAMALSACSDFKVEEVSANYSLVVVENEPSGEICANGGKKITSGIDVDHSGTLSGNEIVSVRYVCTGEVGTPALVEVTDIQPGETCMFGGQMIRTGTDTNGDGQLSENEAQSSYTICSGTTPNLAGNITKVATHLNQSCALLSNQTVQCWGSSVDGTDASAAPIVVDGIVRVKDVAAGCALGEDGLVRCWSGLNKSPRIVSNLSGVKSISGSPAHHVCAVLEDSSVACWGKNEAGQLGNGNFVNSDLPQAVINPDGTKMMGAASVTAGIYHTCARMVDDTARCWGWNGSGQLGADIGDFSSRAIAVIGMSGSFMDSIQQLSLGYTHTCALLTNRSVHCWGNNEVGQLGPEVTGSSNAVPTVVPISDSLNVSAIDAGYGHTCALSLDGTVSCWGWNVYGQLGDPDTERQSSTPVSVKDLGGVVGLVLGEAHSCALLNNGNAKCWGNNSLGQFGNGIEAINAGYDAKPAKTLEISGSVAVSAGYLFNCSLDGEGVVSCWGNNEYGQLGNSNFTASQRFPEVVKKADGTVFSGVQAVRPGYLHTCALAANKYVYCWGDNSYGQLGSGSVSNRTVPNIVGNIANVSVLASGHAHSCAADADGAVKCWGYNEFGQLGDGTTASGIPDVEVELGASDVKGLALGRAHSCAFFQSGKVSCWGNNSYGQLGSEGEDSLQPKELTNISNVEDLSSGHAHSCALLRDGTVSCWGSNIYGECGQAISDSTKVVPPSKVTLPGKATKVVTGYQHTCAILEDKTVSCWGSNAWGQLGNDVLESSGTPTAIGGMTDVVDVSTGSGHTCALTSDGTVSCWGSDRYGQLGRVNGSPYATDAMFIQ